MRGAVNELQRLDQELDVHEPAAAQLHVPPPPRLLTQLDLHAPAHVADLLERPGRQRRTVDESAEGGAHAPRQGPIAQEQPRARQALPLPEVPVLLIVPFERVRARRAAGRAARPARPAPSATRRPASPRRAPSSRANSGPRPSLRAGGARPRSAPAPA